MANHTNSTYETSLTFQLKGGLYPLTALQLLSNNLTAFEQQLIAKIDQAPKFFHHAPVVIDLQKLAHTSSPLDFKKLVSILTQKKLIPVGIKGGSADEQALAAREGLAIIHDNGKEINAEPAVKKLISATKATTHSEELDMKGSNTKIISEPVRSGQQIYVRGGDLIVLAAVSHGSELLADGNIHVYGPLRGRALAGVTGDESAHIFCQSLEAELISIAGQYKISEDVEQTVWRQAVDISLESNRLHIRPL